MAVRRKKSASPRKRTARKKKKLRRGLVLSGGGAFGAYQAGAMKALHEAGLEFEVISATSIGTINALAWNIPEIVRELDAHWLHNVGGLRPFQFSRILSGKNPFQFHSTLESIADAYRGRYPWDKQRAEILITLTDYRTNESTVLSSCDARMPPDERELLMKASTAILHIGSSPVEIMGRKYYDGGYHTNIPIDPILDHDLDEIWIIPLSPIKGGTKRTGRKSKAADAARRRIQNPYIHSLIRLYEQVIDPPEMNLGSAKKIIISPYDENIEFYRAGRNLLFSMKNIRELLRRGYEAGQRAVSRSYARS